MEHDVGGHAVRLRSFAAPFLQSIEQGAASSHGDGCSRSRRSNRLPGRRKLQIVEERARSRAAINRPRQEEVSAGSGDPDVEKPPLLLGVGFRSPRTERELAVDEAGEEHGVELEALRAVVREEVHATAAVLGGEPLRELGLERRVIAAGVGALELRGEGTHSREV